MSTYPILVAVSGLSGSGKSTLIAHLERHYGGGRVITHTTRPVRPGEPANSYHFVTEDEIRSLQDTLWVCENYGHLYAVTKSAIATALEQTGVALIPTTTSHHHTLEPLLRSGKYIGIHLAAPSEATVRRRLARRGENAATIADRLATRDLVERRAWQNPSLLIIPAAVSEEATFTLVRKLIDDHR